VDGGAITSLLTATYMFRLVFLTFHGERPESAGSTAHHGGSDHGHGAGHGPAHLHDAPPTMAVPLVLLAIGSVVAGYVGVPHALGGANRIEGFLSRASTPWPCTHLPRQAWEAATARPRRTVRRAPMRTRTEVPASS